jgi:hypothetical protein
LLAARLGVEGVIERHPQSLQIGNTLGRRGFFNAAGGIPAGEIAYRPEYTVGRFSAKFSNVA